MSDAEYRRVFRHNVREDLETLASPESQLQFQHDVPFVNISVELACNWFDGSYLPDEPDFIALFSETEWKALTKFSDLFGKVTSSFDQANYPEIEELLQNPDWLKVVEAAKIALAALEDD